MSIRHAPSAWGGDGGGGGDDNLMALLVEKIEARAGGRSSHSISREVKRVLSREAARDGWLAPATLAKALRSTWLVGLEARAVVAFAEGVAKRQPNGRLSVDTFAREVVGAAGGSSRGGAETPGDAFSVATPNFGSYHDPTQTTRDYSDAPSDRARGVARLLRDELTRASREELGAWSADDREVRKAAAAALHRRCRALCEKGHKRTQRRLALAQWCVALRGLAIASGLPAPKDRELAELWKDADRGDYAKFARDLFTPPGAGADAAPPPTDRGGRRTARGSSYDRDDATIPARHDDRGSPRRAWAASAEPGVAVEVESPRRQSRFSARDWAAPDEAAERAAQVGSVSPARVFGLSATAPVAYFPPTKTALFGCGTAVVCRDLDEDRIDRVYCGHVVAVASVGAHGRRPVACSGDAGGAFHIWRLLSLEVLHVVGQSAFRSADHCAFLGGGASLACAGVGRDRRPLVAVYDTGTGDSLGEKGVTCGRHGRIRGLAADLDESGDRFATCGDGHVAFWRVDPRREGGLDQAPGRFGNAVARCPAQTAIALAAAPGIAYTSGENGHVYVWRESACLSSFCAHKTGGIAGLSAAPCADALLTCGGDGTVKRWAGPRLAPSGDVRLARASEKNEASLLRAICVDGEGAVALAATARGTLLTCDVTREGSRGRSGAVESGKVRSVVVAGHAGPARAVAAHPTDGRLFASCGDDGRVIAWSVDDGKVKHALRKSLPRALAYSEPTGSTLAVGADDGTVALLDAATLEETGGGFAAFRVAVSKIRYAPDGDVIAVGAKNGGLAVYGASGKRLKSLEGHAAAPTSLDFGLDGDGRSVLRSRDAAGETFYWRIDGTRSGRVAQRAALADRGSWTWRTDTAGDADRTVDRSGGRDDLWAVADAGGLRVASGPGPVAGDRDGAVVHATPIVDVAFLADDAHVVTIAARDAAVVAWAVETTDGPDGAYAGPSSRRRRAADSPYDQSEGDCDDSRPTSPASSAPNGDWPF